MEMMARFIENIGIKLGNMTVQTSGWNIINCESFFEDDNFLSPMHTSSIIKKGDICESES